ncbi:MAG: hypothetical protein WCD56_09905 [Pseudolabrys sp.]
MTVDRIFFAYIALVGAAVGVTLVVAPQVQNFVIKPYFWILIAVGLFDGGIYLLPRMVLMPKITDTTCGIKARKRHADE